MTKPILFNTKMIKAILKGRKTQTRRVIKQALGWDANWKVSKETDTHYCMRVGSQYSLPFFQPQYQIGDVLYVRETILPWINTKDKSFSHVAAYRADGYELESGEKWTPSIHMPKAAARIFLEVTDLKAERLNDISEEDAIAEGVEQNRDGSWYDYIEPNRLWQDTARPSFISLWESIYGTWDANPYVFVYSFKQIDKPENF